MAINTIEADGWEEVPLDRYFRALADEHRRIVLAVLRRRASISLEELADEIVARSAGAHTREQVEVTLVHNHLPMLADLDAVDLDDGRVEKRQPTFERLTELLQPSAP